LVVCKQLGFPVAINATSNSFFGLVPATFAYDSVVCHGNESYLDLCQHANVDDCGVGEGAGVVCDIYRF
jgi:hypothetical protein